MNNPIMSGDSKEINQGIADALPGVPPEKDFLWLMDAVKSLFELPSQADIYQVIATLLQGFINNSIIVVSQCNEPADTICVRATVGIGRQLDELISLLGKHLIGMSVQVNDAARCGLTTEKLERVKGGVYELCTGSIPAGVCNRIERVLNINAVHAIGLICRGRLLGSVAILMRNKGEVKSVKIIETFLSYAAIVLQQQMSPQQTGVTC